MKVRQLSLFLENKPGRLLEPCRLLAQAGINIRTLTLADTEEFGLLRLIVSDWRRAFALLTEAGYACQLTEVLAVEVPDHPGGLASVLRIFEGTGVNIEYMYAFPFGRAGRAVLIFRFNDPDEAARLLLREGVNVLETVEVYADGVDG